MLSILSNYKGKPYICGVNDCNLLLLELTGFDTSQVPPFNTIRSGREALCSATGCKNHKEYLTSIGAELIPHNLVTDGCFLIKGINCFIYFDGLVFGVSKETNTFEWSYIDLEQLQRFEVYSWVQNSQL